MNRPRILSRCQLILCHVIVTLAIVSQTHAQDGKEKVFRAGAFAIDITPPLGELIVGGWTPVPAQHIHDPLHARCLVLDDGQTKLGIVLCDNVGIPREVFDLAKEKIHDATEMPPSHLLLASTHTHSATTARGPSKTAVETELTSYQTFVAQRISDGVRCAINNLEPAKIGWGGVDEPSELFNRRWFVNDPQLSTNPFGGVDQVRMNPPRGHAALDRPAGPIDPEVSFISVKSVDDRPIALLANYSLHYVGGVGKQQISADYFGYFAGFIKSHLGADDVTPPFVGILSNGTSGDVNNINFREKSPKRYAPYEKMQIVAGKVADRVAQAHEKLEYRDWVQLGAAMSELTLKTRKPTPEMLAHFEEISKHDESEAPRHRRETIYAKRIARIQQDPSEIQIPLQTLRIGDLGIAAIPFETFTETGLEIKDRSVFKDTFTIELANGSFGYLPTPEQHRLGGYETWLGTNYVEKQASVRIVRELLTLFEKLHRE